MSPFRLILFPMTTIKRFSKWQFEPTSVRYVEKKRANEEFFTEEAMSEQWRYLNERYGIHLAKCAVGQAYMFSHMLIGPVAGRAKTDCLNGERYIAKPRPNTFGVNLLKASPVEAVKQASNSSQMPEGVIGPIEGIKWHRGKLYVRHRSRYSTLDKQPN
jgi:hypothetical protein